MKAGIITKIGKNYGAVLQAYALKQACCNLGVEAHIIKYQPESSKKSYKICRFSWGFRGAKANICSLLHYHQIKEGSKRFWKFRDEHFDFIGDYSTAQEIEVAPPECDIYISGSDQVWNPMLSFDRTYYCMFVEDDSVKRIAAYAASIGLNSLPEDIKEEFQTRLRRFHYISVRERQGQKILRALDIPSVIAPDPTLLFAKDEWDQIATDTIVEPYILCYFVSFPKGVEKLIKKIQKKMEIKVINLMTSEESNSVGDIKIRDAGPREFLGLFKNAKYIITSSFHGTVFSIINRKPFVTILYNSTRSRVVELLDTLNLTNRIISSDEENIDSYLETEFYSEETVGKIISLREQGIEILKDILRED